MTNELTETIRDIAETKVDDPQDSVAYTNVTYSPPNATQQTGWMDADPKFLTDALENRSQNRTQLIDWVRANLQEGTDFGIIKNKKALWKPGAEKVCGMLGLQVSWPSLESELNRMRDGADTIWLSCELLRDGHVQAQGAGSRSMAADGGDGNKAIKMCKKSAMIDAVLNVAGLSEVFTQDIEDDNLDTLPLSEGAQNALSVMAYKLFPDNPGDVLKSLARRRFKIDSGDWRKIPAFRLADAIRSLEEKAAQDAAELES